MTLSLNRQVFSDDTKIIKSNILVYLEHNSNYNTFGNYILAKVIACNLTMSNLTFSHTWIAKSVGSKARKTPQRHIPNIIATGILTQKKRGFKETNLYTLHPYAKSQEFLEMLAPHFHEIRLYLIRKAKELLRNSLYTVSQGYASGIKKVQCALTELYNGGVPLFKYPSLNSYYDLIRQYKAAQIKPEIPRKGTMDDFRTKELAKLEEKAGLSPAGAIALAGYSDRVLEQARKQFVLQKGRIRRPFFWLSHVCKQIALEYKERYDYRKVNLLNQLYGIADNEPKTVAAKQIQMADIRNSNMVSKPIVQQPKPAQLALSREEVNRKIEEATKALKPDMAEFIRELWKSKYA